MPPKGSIIAGHGDSRYRAGCRCGICREDHADVSRAWKWEQTYGEGGPMGPKIRGRILASLKRTRNVVETAREVDVTYQAIYRAAKAVPGFGDLIDNLTTPRD
jgi:hypothetical protein